MKKIVVCVMSSRIESENCPWWSMIDLSKRTWDSVEVPNVQTIFHVGAPAQPLTDKIIGFDVGEELHDLGRRNLACFRYLLETDPSWRYLARINASCYCSKPRLAKFCEELPEEGVVVGGVIDGEGENKRRMWGGLHFILSRDVVQAIVDNEEQWNHRVMEDVSLSHLVFGLGFDVFGKPRSGGIDYAEGKWSFTNYHTGNNFAFADITEIKDKADCCFIRLKQDWKRHLDKWLMQELFDKYDNTP